MRRRFRFLFFLIPIAFLSLGSLAVMGLWNWLMPALFSVGTVTFWQAAALLILGRLLLGGYGRPGYGRPGFRGRFWSRRFAYADPGEAMRTRWENLTPEQQARFAARCGWKRND